MAHFAIAVDIGGTKVEAALVTPAGELVAGSRNRHPTGRDMDSHGLEAALDQVINASLLRLPDIGEIDGFGIGSAGPIDLATGTIHPVNMPEARGFGVVDAVARIAAEMSLSSTPVRLGHDGGCLALAESWRGAARSARASMSIVVSTGVGGGIAVGGRPLRGASGNAGHLGQTRVDLGIGWQYGLTLEEVASGPASVDWARAQGWEGQTGEDIARDAAAGGILARAAIERSATAVGRALSDAATLLDLDVVVIGGGFSRVSDDYIDLVQAALTDTAALPYSSRTRVVRSGLGDEGPLIGAAALVLRG